MSGYIVMGIIAALPPTLIGVVVLLRLGSIHGLVNFRLDQALAKIEVLKNEIMRLNREGLITPKRHGDVQIHEGVVTTPQDREKKP